MENGEGGSANIPQLFTAGGGRSFRISTLKQKQERGSNNCAFFSAAYMTDIVSHQADGIPEAICVDGEEQRKWFCDCLLQATLVLCPRINERHTILYCPSLFAPVEIKDFLQPFFSFVLQYVQVSHPQWEEGGLTKFPPISTRGGLSNIGLPRRL